MHKTIPGMEGYTGKIFMAEFEEAHGSNIDVLDHGFVRVVDSMGDDSAIVQAARVSYGVGTKTLSEDRSLIRYLMRHWHTTPFEMCEIKLHVKLPVFVARQWIRHRTANVNEYSARYSIMKNEFYIPEALNIGVQSQSNNQGRDIGVDPIQFEGTVDSIEASSNAAYDMYKELLNDPESDVYADDMPGVARELSRMVLPTNIYTEWYWKIDLHNLLRFLRLRQDSHAQWEIRQYADAIASVVEKWVPYAWNAFQDYQAQGVHFSRMERIVLAELLTKDLRERKPLDVLDTSVRKPSGMSDREWNEFMIKVRELFHV